MKVSLDSFGKYLHKKRTVEQYLFNSALCKHSSACYRQSINVRELRRTLLWMCCCHRAAVEGREKPQSELRCCGRTRERHCIGDEPKRTKSLLLLPSKGLCLKKETYRFLVQLHSVACQVPTTPIYRLNIAKKEWASLWLFLEALGCSVLALLQETSCCVESNWLQKAMQCSLAGWQLGKWESNAKYTWADFIWQILVLVHILGMIS